MNLRAFLDELVKIADAGPPAPSKPTPINATAPKGPSVPTNGIKLPALPAAARGGMAVNAIKLAMKLAAIGARTMLPGSSAGAMRQVQTAVRDVRPLAPIKNVPNEAAVAARFNPPTRPPPAQSGSFSMAPRSVVTPTTSPTSNTIPAPAAASSAPTQLPPAPTGSGMRPAPVPTTPSTGQQLAPTLPPPSRLPKFAEANPPHGAPGHDHQAAVEKLRAAIKDKHPHLVEKKSSVAEFVGKQLGPKSAVGKHMVNNSHAYDLGGLGILALPAADHLVEQAEESSKGNEVDKREVARSGLELAGLGTLAAPTAVKMLHGGH